MKPSEKTPQMEDALKNLVGFDRREFIYRNECVICKKEVVEFRDELSKREFSISGLCQSCQDKVFLD